MLTVTLKSFLLKKEKKKIINKNEVVQKETLLVNNDEIAKALKNHFSETGKVEYI